MTIERKESVDGLAPIVEVAALFEPEWLVEIDVTAVVG
jgi:hypothetical protein